MNLDAVQAVIDSAKARGTESLDRFVRERLPEASEEEIEETVETAVEIIDTVPIMMARASQEAQERNLAMVVQPLLDHAERYFLHPIDLIPEMTMGLAGLLDDAYLVLKILRNLQSGPDPLLDWDLDQPTTFIRHLVGERVGRQLDDQALTALQEISENVSKLWEQMAHEA